MTAVADSSPLIALSALSCLELLKVLFSGLLIPEAVYREVVLQGQGKPGAREVREAEWIRQAQVRDQQAVEALIGRFRFERGEAEAIVLVKEAGVTWIILDEDDQGPRRYARELGISVIGTLGVLLRAKREGHVASLGDKLEELKASGFWIDPALAMSVLRAAGEG